MVAGRKRQICHVNELGAETVQLVFALPVLFVVIMSIVQLCVMAFFTLTLSGEAEQAAWAVDLESMRDADADQRNQLVRKAIIDSAAVIDANCLSVDNSTLELGSPYSHQQSTSISDEHNVLVDEDNGFAYGLSEMYRETTAGIIEFDVRYKLPSFINLPGLSNMTVTKHIARERVLSTRTEVR